MTRTVLDADTCRVSRILDLMVVALNMAFLANEEATDIMLDLDETDGLFSDLRDWTNDTQERLFLEIKEIAVAHNLELRFNRLDGSFVLMDVTG